MSHDDSTCAYCGNRLQPGQTIVPVYRYLGTTLDDDGEPMVCAARLWAHRSCQPDAIMVEADQPDEEALRAGDLEPPALAALHQVGQ